MKEPPQIRTGKAIFIKRDPSPEGYETTKPQRGLDHLSDTCYAQKMNEILRNVSSKNKHQENFKTLSVAFDNDSHLTSTIKKMGNEF